MLISAFVSMSWSQVMFTGVMLTVSLHFDELMTLMVDSAIVKITAACWMVDSAVETVSSSDYRLKPR